MPLLPAGIGQFLGDVPPKRRIHDVVVGLLRGEEAEPVVVLRRQHHIFHAGGLGDAGPLVGVEFHRVELLVEGVVLLDRRLRPARPADLLVRQADRPPMDEHAESHLLPPLDGGGVGFHPWLGFRLDSVRCHSQRQQYTNGRQGSDELPAACTCFSLFNEIPAMIAASNV